MPDNCENSACAGLTRLEQQVDDMRKQNGADHKEMRGDIQRIERNETRLEGRMDHLVETTTEIKVGNKEINDKLNTLVNQADDVKRHEKDLDELKAKPGKRWEDIVKQVIGLVVAALVGVVIARLGL